jgi:hypothetical protein
MKVRTRTCKKVSMYNVSMWKSEPGGQNVMLVQFGTEGEG